MLPLVGLALGGLLGTVAWVKSTTDAMVAAKKKENAAELAAAHPHMQVFNAPAPAVELYLDPLVAEAAKAGAPWAKAWGRYLYEVHKDRLPAPALRRG